MAKVKRAAENKKKNTDSASSSGKGMKIGIVLIVIFLLIYIPSFILWIYGTDINTAVIQMGTIEESINSDGYIIRDEKVLLSSIGGKYIRKVNEGEKISSGFGLVTVFKDSSVKLVERLNTLDREILEIQKEKSNNQAFFSSDIAKIDAEIERWVEKLADESNKSALSGTDRYKNEIDGMIQKKALIIGDQGSADDNLKSLKNERDAVEAQIASGTKQLVSEESGIVSYFIDGYEDKLSPGGISSLTPEILDGIKPVSAAPGPASGTIEAGEPFAKLIRDFEYYIAVCLDESKAGNFKSGSTIDVRINDIDRVLSGNVVNTSGVSGGRVVITVKVNKSLSETTGLRKINADIIKNNYQGLKVPLKSLKNADIENMTAKIVMNEANYAKTRDVKIVGYNDEFAIIENADSSNSRGVSRYASYIVNPENIEDGQMIEK